MAKDHSSTVIRFIQREQVRLAEAERLEDWDRCIEIRDLINAIREDDYATYIRIVLDVDGLTEVGFFNQGMTYPQMRDRVNVFFGFDSIYEYSVVTEDFIHG